MGGIWFDSRAVTSCLGSSSLFVRQYGTRLRSVVYYHPVHLDTVPDARDLNKTLPLHGPRGSLQNRTPKGDEVANGYALSDRMESIGESAMILVSHYMASPLSASEAMKRAYKVHTMEKPRSTATPGHQRCRLR